jgi:hypothetical protein
MTENGPIPTDNTRKAIISTYNHPYALTLENVIAYASASSTAKAASFGTMEATDLDDDGIHVYPNPAHSKVTIDLSLYPGLLFNVQISELNGKIQMESTLAGGSKHELNTPKGLAGMYLLLIKGGTQSTIKKIIFQQ